MTAVLHAIDSPDSPRRNRAAAALAAHEALNRPVAVLSHDRSVVFSNPAFDALFAQPGQRAAVMAALDGGLPDDVVQVTPLPQGWLVCLDEGTDVALAMHHARQAAGLFEPAMDAGLTARRALEGDLRRALALREFVLVYQPQVNLFSGRVTGFEALLRWTHPQRGAVAPRTFIPLAEAIGAIVPIGEWVLRSACREAAGWSHPLGLSVNVSAAQLAHAGFVPAVLSALGDSALEPRRLEVEITEDALFGDRAATLSALHRLRAVGVRVALDDFGSGHAALSSLDAFPFDTVKIDQPFVRGEGESGATVRAIAALGRSLGMSTVAEGVETEAQRRRVAAEGCTDIQGHLIARPLPPEAIEAFLQTCDVARCDPQFRR
jgi:EAL domain-containing protein (putative c-di-GMP-specific phosphodiesterase class I)